MSNTWNWIFLHWENWAVSGAFGFMGGVLGGTFKWFYPSRKEWKEERKAKADKKLESEILALLSDHQIWKSANIAGRLSRDHESVVEALGARLSNHFFDVESN